MTTAVVIDTSETYTGLVVTVVLAIVAGPRGTAVRELRRAIG